MFLQNTDPPIIFCGTTTTSPGLSRVDSTSLLVPFAGAPSDHHAIRAHDEDLFSVGDIRRPARPAQIPVRILSGNICDRGCVINLAADQARSPAAWARSAHRRCAVQCPHRLSAQLAMSLLILITSRPTARWLRSLCNTWFCCCTSNCSVPLSSPPDTFCPSLPPTDVVSI